MGDDMKKDYRFSDQLLGRVLNVIQEAMISGVDVLDLFREMRVKPADGDPHELVLTEDYTKKVDEWHKQIERELQRRKEDLDNNQEGRVFITGTGGPDVKKIGGTIHVDPSMIVDPNKKTSN